MTILEVAQVGRWFMRSHWVAPITLRGGQFYFDRARDPVLLTACDILANDWTFEP